MTPTEAVLELLRSLPADGSLLVVTGAGISVASGIPTFRGTDPGAIWTRDVTELGTYRFFEEDPVASWRWYLSRFDTVFGARPNPAHDAVAALERWHVGRGGEFLLVTQNIDVLHEEAGSRAMVKVHGSADRVRCTRPGCRNASPTGSLPRASVDMDRFVAAPGPDTLPRCPACGALLRQQVLWFDETYDSHVDYAFPRALAAADACDRLLFVGTSFAVGATDAFLRCARRARAWVMSVDPGEHRSPAWVDRVTAKAEEVLPAACRALGAG